MSIPDANAMPRLARRGDERERANCGNLRNLIPHYEVFWQLYVFPLRKRGSIELHEGIEPILESVAIASYSTFDALAEARRGVGSKKMRTTRIEQIYVAIQRAIEVGIKLADGFEELEGKYCNSEREKRRVPLDDFLHGRLKRYRNLIHDPMTPQVIVSGERMIPKLEKLDEYRLWSKAKNQYNPNDFIPASVQVKNDFRAACSLLENLWNSLCKRYPSVGGSLPLHESMRPALASAASPTGAPAVSGSFTHSLSITVVIGNQGPVGKD